MKKRLLYIILLGFVLVSGIAMGIGVELKPEPEVLTDVEENGRDGRMLRIDLRAGISTLLRSSTNDFLDEADASVFLETYKAEDTRTSRNVGSEAVAVTPEEDEYSDLAIADVVNYVNVRNIPNTEGEIVGKMYDGSVAQILSVTREDDGEWFQVVSGDVEGYIKAEFFIFGAAAADVIDDYVTRYAVVRADRLNVRIEPDINTDRIGYVDYGEKVKITEYGEEWTQILYTEGKKGYVASEYITVEEEFIYAKSIAEEQAELEAQRMLAKRAEESEQAAPEDTTVTAPVLAANYSTNTELRSSIVQYAMQYLGTGYVHGGRSLATGTDCSGFTCYVYAQFGYALSRTPEGQWSSNGRNIGVDEIQPGDIVCYSSNGSKCTHVGLYIGNGQIIHEANSRKGTVISDLYYDNTFIGVKNVIG